MLVAKLSPSTPRSQCRARVRHPPPVGPLVDRAAVETEVSRSEETTPLPTPGSRLRCNLSEPTIVPPVGRLPQAETEVSRRGSGHSHPPTTEVSDGASSQGAGCVRGTHLSYPRWPPNERFAESKPKLHGRLQKLAPSDPEESLFLNRRGRPSSHRPSEQTLGVVGSAKCNSARARTSAVQVRRTLPSPPKERRD